MDNKTTNIGRHEVIGLAVALIVEGKHDRSKLRRLLSEEVRILCTYGTPSSKQLAQLVKAVGDDEVFIFTDNDSSGRRIRYMISELFSDATHMYTRRGYAGVEGTPDEYLLQQIDKHGLSEYILPGN
jgi:toprim domain protein